MNRICVSLDLEPTGLNLERDAIIGIGKELAGNVKAPSAKALGANGGGRGDQFLAIIPSLLLYANPQRMAIGNSAYGNERFVPLPLHEGTHDHCPATETRCSSYTPDLAAVPGPCHLPPT